MLGRGLQAPKPQQAAEAGRRAPRETLERTASRVDAPGCAERALSSERVDAGSARSNAFDDADRGACDAGDGSVTSSSGEAGSESAAESDALAATQAPTEPSTGPATASEQTDAAEPSTNPDRETDRDSDRTADDANSANMANLAAQALPTPPAPVAGIALSLGSGSIEAVDADPSGGMTESDASASAAAGGDAEPSVPVTGTASATLSAAIASADPMDALGALNPVAQPAGARSSAADRAGQRVDDAQLAADVPTAGRTGGPADASGETSSQSQDGGADAQAQRDTSVARAQTAMRALEPDGDVAGACGSTQAGSTQAGSTQAGSTQAGSTKAGSTQASVQTSAAAAHPVSGRLAQVEASVARDRIRSALEQGGMAIEATGGDGSSAASVGGPAAAFSAALGSSSIDRTGLLEAGSTLNADPASDLLSNQSAQASGNLAAKGLDILAKQRGGSITMRLEPPALGQLRVELQISQGAVVADFTAATAEARTLLEANLGMLRERLESHGLSVERISVHGGRGAEGAAVGQAPQSSDLRQDSNSGGGGDARDRGDRGGARQDAAGGESRGRRDDGDGGRERHDRRERREPTGFRSVLDAQPAVGDARRMRKAV